MMELARIEREISKTQAGIRRSWRDLGGLNMPLDKRVAEIVSIDATQRRLAELLARREELHPAA